MIVNINHGNHTAISAETFFDDTAVKKLTNAIPIADKNPKNTPFSRDFRCF